MSKAIIRKVLEGRLKTWAAAQSPAIQVSWQNVAFSPPTELYFRSFIVPSPTFSSDLLGSHRGYTGIHQISIVCPQGAGAGEAEAIVGLLDTEFPKNLRLTDSGVEVLIQAPVSEGPHLQEKDRYVVPIWYEYRSDTI